MWPFDALSVFSEPFGQRLTWTLLHFCWQGLAVAAALLAVLWLLRIREARTRYALSLAAMLTMAACPLVTFPLLNIDAAYVVSDKDVGWDVSWGQHVGWDEAQQSPTNWGQRAAWDEAQRSPTNSDRAVRQDQTVRQDEAQRSPTETPTHAQLRPNPPTASQPPVTATSPPRLADYARHAQPYLLAGWITGVLLLSGRLLLGLAGVQWLRRGRCPIPPELTSCAARLGERLGLRSAVAVFTSERVREAVVVGLLRPMVLLPTSWLMEMTPEVLEAVIAHELSHIRRWDLWINLMQRLAETLLFYHPAVWWLSRRIRLQREMCCDELAVAATGRRVAYASALEVVAGKRLATIWPEMGTAMGGNKMVVLDRVCNVLGLPPLRQTARCWPVGLVTLLVLPAIWWTSTSMSPFGQAEAWTKEERPRVEMPQAEKPPADARPQQGTPAPPDATKPFRVEPLDLLNIKAIGTLPDQPIDQVYLVEPSGRVCLGPAYGRVQLKGLRLAESESAITKHLRNVLTNPEVQVVAAGRLTGWWSAVLPKVPYHVRPGDQLAIRATGTLVDQPIAQDYLVEPTGHVPLGPAYGRVQLQGLTLPEAEDAIRKHLGRLLTEPAVTVGMAGWKTTLRPLADLNAPYHIAPADLLDIQVLSALPDQPIAGTYLVEPDGRVALGPLYGRVLLKGLTLEQAEDAVGKHLSSVLVSPAVSVTLAGWKDELQAEETPATTTGAAGEVSRELRLSARLALALELSTLHWKAFETDKYDRTSESARARGELVKALDADIRQTAQSDGWQLRFIWTHRQGNTQEALDEFEQQAMARIKAGDDEVWQRTNRGETRTVQAIRASNDTCVLCHNAVGRDNPIAGPDSGALKKHDLMALASLRLSAHEAQPTAP